jgi:flagellar biosynthesis regulator FlaF
MSDGAMQQMLATRRYGATQRIRSLREQEADVFRRINYGLKAALNADAVDQARAIAENRRLWMALEAAVTHPTNQLPEALKGSILNLSRRIQKEIDAPIRDIPFLIDTNEQMIAGLSGDPG